MKHASSLFQMNARGMSLIEVLVSLGLVCLLSVGMTALTTSMARSNQVLSSQQSLNSLQSDIRTQLQRKISCLPSFESKPNKWTGVQTVGVNLGTRKVAASTDVSNYGLHVDSLLLTNIQDMGKNNTGNQLYAADLRISGSSLKLSSQKNKAGEEDRFSFRERIVSRLMFEVDASNTAISCYGADPDVDVQNLTQVFCEQNGGTYDAAKAACVEGAADEDKQLTSCVAGVGTNADCAQVLPKPIAFEDIAAGDVKTYSWYCPSKMGLASTSAKEATKGCIAVAKFFQPTAGDPTIPSGTTCSVGSGSNTTVKKCAAGILITSSTGPNSGGTSGVKTNDAAEGGVGGTTVGEGPGDSSGVGAGTGGLY